MRSWNVPDGAVRRFIKQKVQSLSKPSLTAMKVAFVARSQYVAIFAILSLFVFQLIGVTIFSQTARAADVITFDHKVVSENERDNHLMKLDSLGNIYLADTSNKVVRVYDPNGNYLRQWGSAGTGNGQFGGMAGIGIDSEDNVYIFDLGNHRVQKFTNMGTYITQWGSDGTDDGQFTLSFGSLKAGVAVDADDNVYIGDFGNHRVQKFTNMGTYITQWGSSGTGTSQFNDLIDIAADSIGNVYTVEGHTESPFVAGRVQKFDTDGNYQASFVPDNTSIFGSPSLAIGPNNRLYVSYYDTIKEYNTSGTLVRTLQNDGIGCYAGGIAVNSSGNIYASDCLYPNSGLGIKKTDASYETVLASFSAVFEGVLSPVDIATAPDGSYYAVNGNARIIKYNSAGIPIRYGGTSDQDPYAGGIARDSQGNLYVTDYHNQRVLKFNANGSLTTSWGSAGTGNGQFNTPTGITIDSQDNIYVAEYGGNRVQKFSSAGTYITKWGSSGTGNGQFAQPRGLEVDADDNVYVADGGNHRVQKFSSTGTYLAQWGSSGTGNGQFGGPDSIVVDQVGDIYVSDGGNHRVQKFSSTGTYLAQWGSSGTGNGQFGDIITLGMGLAIDSSGRIYVADIGNTRIQAFTVSPSLDITTTSLPDGTVGSAYNQTITANKDDVDFSIDSGGLPPGLSLASSGSITGTPTASGTYTFTVLADDQNSSDIDTQVLEITIGEQPPEPFAITTTSLPGGTVDEDYGANIETDSDDPILFSVASGSLPDGLDMNSDGEITGIPRTAGAFSFTIEADNGAMTDTQELSITIEDATIVDEILDPESDPELEPESPTEDEIIESGTEELNDATEVLKLAVPVRTSPLAADNDVQPGQNSLFALAKRIPEPFALGFPWLLLLLALILVSSQYYQVHSESVATGRMKDKVMHQKQLVEEQNNFVALSTHYLHTPLTVMEGEISLMVKAGTMTQEHANKLLASLELLATEAEALLAQEEQHESNA